MGNWGGGGIILSPLISPVSLCHFISSTSSSSSLLQPNPQLPLLLGNLQLEPLHTILKRLLPLPDCPRPQTRPAIERLAAALLSRPALLGRRALEILRPAAQTARVEVTPCLQGLDAPGLALGLAVGAVEEVGHEGADFVAEGGFCCGEGGLGDEFVVLF